MVRDRHRQNEVRKMSSGTISEPARDVRKYTWPKLGYLDEEKMRRLGVHVRAVSREGWGLRSRGRALVGSSLLERQLDRNSWPSPPRERGSHKTSTYGDEGENIQRCE